MIGFYPARNSHVVHGNVFDNGIVKLINEIKAQLTQCKRDSVNSIGRSSILDKLEAVATVNSYYEQLQLTKCRRLPLESLYINCTFGSAITASVE